MNIHSSTGKWKASERLGDRLRIARHRADISQTALAHAIGVSPSAVAQWEHPSGTQPSLENLLRAAEITGASIQWLATGNLPRSSPATASGDVPAIALDAYAQTLQEEHLLDRFRYASASQRSLLLKIADEFASLSRRSKRR